MKKPIKEYSPPSGQTIEPLKNIKEKLYLNDPVLTFEDSMLYGCYLELTYAELDSFCNNQGWFKMLIF